MLRETFFLILAAVLAALVASTEARAWGGYHVGYTHVGPAGAYHYGRTGVYGGYGGAYRYGYGVGGVHYGYGGVYGAPYGAYYGGYRYVPGYYGGAYRYGYLY
jgi:hypothetical protein